MLYLQTHFLSASVLWLVIDVLKLQFSIDGWVEDTKNFENYFFFYKMFLKSRITSFFILHAKFSSKGLLDFKINITSPLSAIFKGPKLWKLINPSFFQILTINSQYSSEFTGLKLNYFFSSKSEEKKFSYCGHCIRVQCCHVQGGIN